MREARKTGETARVGAGISRRFTLARARGGAPSIPLFGKKERVRPAWPRGRSGEAKATGSRAGLMDLQARGLSIGFPGPLSRRPKLIPRNQ